MNKAYCKEICCNECSRNNRCVQEREQTLSELKGVEVLE